MEEVTTASTQRVGPTQTYIVGEVRRPFIITREEVESPDPDARRFLYRYEGLEWAVLAATWLFAEEPTPGAQMERMDIQAVREIRKHTVRKDGDVVAWMKTRGPVVELPPGV